MNEKNIDLNKEKCDNDNVVIKLENGAIIELGGPCPPISDFFFTIKEEDKDDKPSP
jgi:hypothetical protein